MHSNGIGPIKGSTRDSYSYIYKIGIAEDSWHLYSTRVILTFIRRYLTKIFFGHEKVAMLNAGSGDIDYGLKIFRALNSDFVLNALLVMPRSFVSDLENLPISDGALDAEVCVGSVLNYLDASAAVMELARCVRPGGVLI